MTRRKYTKEEKFEKLIWNAYSQSDNYHHLRHRLVRARNIMCESHHLFTRLSAERQYAQCLTIVMIATHTAHQNMNKLRVLSTPKDGPFDYSIEEGETKPVTIELKPVKLLS